MHAAKRKCFIEAVSPIVDSALGAELFDLFQLIAVLPYEDAANSGFLLLGPPAPQYSPLSIRFDEPFDISEIRGVRKMLQISGDHLYLLCAGRSVPGFAPSGATLPGAMILQFHHDGMWELKRDGTNILQVQVTQDRSAAQTFSQSRFGEYVRDVFGHPGEVDMVRLWDLISAAAKQLRGTNVLISEAAAREAERLGSQVTRVTPVLLSAELMERVTSIDGTVIIDPRGMCYAIGGILDGPVSGRGDRTRGGRYNSALMYADHTPFRSLIVVISQDGMVDFVCNSPERPAE
jgi:hypothetical protein